MPLCPQFLFFHLLSEDALCSTLQPFSIGRQKSMFLMAQIWYFNFWSISFLHCNAQQGRTGSVQGNPVMKTELSCFHYRIFPVTGKNSNNCRINLLSSHDFLDAPSHIRRFQEYFNHINNLISSNTLQFLQFWYQNGVNYLFLIVKSIEVTSGFISKVIKKLLGGATIEIFDI